MYDILLINTHREHFSTISEDINIGINLLTVFLKEKGYNVALFRGSAHEAIKWTEEIMKKDGAKTMGFYCDYANQTLVEEFSRKVKETWNVPVFTGGPQAVGLGEDFFRKSHCDVVVRGDGEFTLLDLLDVYIKNEKKLSEIDGISYIQEGKVVCRPDRKAVEDLDSLPWPDFRMEKNHKSWVYLPVLTGRGCPYRCAFCYEGGNTKTVRFRSVESIIKEIQCHFERHPQIKHIFIADDTFTLNPQRVEKFCRELSRMRKERDFIWFCEAHVQPLLKWPEMLEQMVEAGMIKILLGIESGSDRVLELYRKSITTEMIKTVMKNCVKAGVSQILGNIIIGGPIESNETLQADLELIKELLYIAPGKFDPSCFFLIPHINTAIKLNPGDFGIHLLPERDLQALEDIPQTETDNLSWVDMFNAKIDFNKKTLAIMKELYVKGKIPLETIINCYRLLRKYCVYSIWIPNVFAVNPVEHLYYQYLSGGIMKHSQDIKGKSLLLCRPQRVFELWNTVSYERGYPLIDKYVLSPVEYELLLLCSGKLPLNEIIKRVYETSGDGFDTGENFESFSMEILKNFEDRRWIGYSDF